MMNLRGLRILNTRPEGQNQSFSESIRKAGGIALECPTLAIEAVPLNQPLAALLTDLSSFDIAIFISTNAVKYFFELLFRKQTPWQNTIAVYAVGQATANALQTVGIKHIEFPQKTGSEGLLELDSLQHISGKRILLVKGESGRTLIERTATIRKAKVIPFSVYRRVCADVSTSWIRSIWQQDAVDVLVFTSEESMHNLFLMFDKVAHPWLQQKTCWVVSQRLAEAAKRYGYTKVRTASYETLLQAIQKNEEGKNESNG